MPGYEPEDDWQKKFARIAIKNFFHAIVKGELEVAIGDLTITAGSISSCAQEYLESPRERYLVEASTASPVAETHIPGIGKVTLHIKFHSHEGRSRSDIALVRDAGMLITRVRNRMGPAQVSIPSHWTPFTAIVDCRSDQEEKSFIRQAENPNHNELSVDHISDRETRSRARKALLGLSVWVKEEIRKQAEPANSSEPVNAGEASRFLPITPTNPSDHGYKPGSGEISQPVQRSTGGAATRRNQPPPPPNPRPTPRPSPHKPPKPRPMPKLDPLAQAKFRAGGRHSTHGLIIEIPPFDQTIDNVHIDAVSEHGNDTPMKITGVWRNNRQLPTGRGKIRSLSPSKEKPVTLELTLQEPVAGRRFRLKNSSPRSNAA